MRELTLEASVSAPAGEIIEQIEAVELFEPALKLCVVVRLSVDHENVDVHAERAARVAVAVLVLYGARVDYLRKRVVRESVRGGYSLKSLGLGVALEKLDEALVVGTGHISSHWMFFRPMSIRTPT